MKQIMDMADAIGGMYRSESDKNGTSYTIMIPLGKQHLLIVVSSLWNPNPTWSN